MYFFIKKLIKKLFPRKYLFKKELLFRNFYGLLYVGNTHQCNICNKNLHKFITLENKDLLCPFCGSLSRNRMLWLLLNKNNSIKGNILHFSPSRSLYRTLKKVKTINYYSTDFEDEFLADYKYNITAINQKEETFDIIICYHILEHVIDDQKALCELYRVLKQDGKAYIQTPFKEGNIYEDYTLVSPEERLKHFGQEDHVRIYSINELKARLENVGFKIKIETFEKSENDFKNGFIKPETVLIATK
jgi:SAM-dependent methyltransferase